MANVDKAFGLRALGNLSATGSQKQFGYQIADNQSGAIFQGDLVTLKDGFILSLTHHRILRLLVFSTEFFIPILRQVNLLSVTTIQVL